MNEEAKQETSREPVKHIFTDAEKLELGEQMSQAIANGADLEGQLSALKKDFQGRIEAEANTVKTCARNIQNGFETRFVMCDVVKDYKAKVIRYKSQEDGVVVRERAMTHADLQKKLFEGDEEPEDIN